MNNITFANISQEDCKGIYPKVLDNAEDKWRAAQILSGHEQYGNACALYIISIEEFIKGGILFADSHGFEFRRVKGIDHFFRNHSSRYILAYWVYIIAYAGDRLKELISKYDELPTAEKNLLELYKNKDAFKRRAELYLMRRVIEIRNELEWFAKIDSFRQDSLYTDFIGDLKSPLDIDKTTHDNLVNKLSKVKNVCRYLFSVMSQPTYEGSIEIDKMKQEFKTKRYYDSVAVSLKNMQKSTKDPFQVIRSLFEKL